MVCLATKAYLRKVFISNLAYFKKALTIPIMHLCFSILIFEIFLHELHRLYRLLGNYLLERQSKYSENTRSAWNKACPALSLIPYESSTMRDVSIRSMMLEGVNAKTSFPAS